MALAIATPLTASLLLVTCVLIVRSYTASDHAASERFRRAARVAADQLGERWRTADADALQRVLEVFAVVNASAAVIEPDGAVRVVHPAGLQGPLTPPPAVLERARILGWAEESVPPGRWLPEFHWVAVRIGQDEGAGIVTAVREHARLADVSGGLWPVLLLTGAAAAAATLAVRALISSLWTRELLHLTHVVRGGAGEAATPEATFHSPELGLLTRAVSQMRHRLLAQIETTEQQRLTFESLLNQLREGVVVIAPDGDVVLINPAAVRLLGLSGARKPAEYVGLAFERVLPHLDLQKLVQRWIAGQEARRRRDEVRRGFQELRLQIETPAGVTFLLAQINDIVLPTMVDGLPSSATGGVLVITDISTLVRTVQVKADFVANASHELRTPLSTIRASIEALKSLPVPDPGGPAERFIDMLDRQSRRLEELTNDLLDLARLESQAQHFPVDTLRLTEVLEELQTHFGPRAAAAGILFESNVAAPEEDTLETSPQLLRMILDNLIDNALKFTPAGKRVRLAATVDHTHVELEIADEGCGIAPEEQQRVFERFYQVERARSGQRRGTGLGLSIVRHAVRTLSGEIELSSAVGDGTTVTVRLPRSPDTQAARLVAELDRL